MAAPINLQANVQIQNLSQMQREIQQATQNLKINMGGGNAARSLSALSQPLGRLTGQADEFSKSLDAANARVLAFGASVGIVNTLSNAFKSLVNSTIEVEKAITAISVVGDQFTGKSKQLSQGLFSIAKATGQSFEEVSKAALEFSRQGLKLEDTLQRTQDALILTRLTGLDASKSVDGLTASVNAFAKAGLSTTQILNKLAAVDQAFAVSSADLIEGFNRSAAVAQNAGVTFDELAGIITTLQQETSRGGAVIGNALKTIFTRLQDTSTLNQLQNLGVAVQDLEGNLLPARQILQNLATDVEGLGQITRAGIFKDVAGTFQINQLISLVGDLGKANSVTAEATKVSAGATNEAFTANQKLNQSLDAIINKVSLTGKQLGALLGEIGLGDNLKGILDGINSFLEGASNLLQGDDLGSRFAKGIVKGIGSVLTGPGIGLFLAIIAKLSFDLAKFGVQSLKTFFNIGQSAKEQQQVQESIVQTLIRNQSVLSQIVNTQGGQNAQAIAFLNILRQEEDALQNIRTLAGGIAAPVIAQGYRPGAQGLTRRSAGGYLPAQEASDVRRGVGGASPSSKVVSIPNFAFGGGKRGTMIANTSEYIVPNYAGGGSAIFNQDMVKTMGLPAGAKKITASGGFIPNFSGGTKDNPLDVHQKYALLVNDLNSPRLNQLVSYKPRNEDKVYYKANVYGIGETENLQGIGQIDRFKSQFSTKFLEEKYKNLALEDIEKYANAVIGQPISPVAQVKLANKGSVPSLIGSIFESAIISALKDPDLIEAQLNRDDNAPFDFKGVAKSQFNKFFGIDENINFVEAKYADNDATRQSFASKIYRLESGKYIDKPKTGISTDLKGRWLSYNNLSSKKSIEAKEMYKSIAQDLGLDPIRDRTQINALMNKSTGRSSSGYIPNFASDALQAAISRERSAGISASQIYVDQSPALKSAANPMGLMVANRRDEPAGGFQGVSRARREGVNPKTYGASKGFVPNFVQVPQAILNQNAQANAQATNPDPKNIEAVNKGFADTAGKIFLLQSAVSFLNGAVEDSDTSFARFTQELSSAGANITSLAFLGKEINDIKIDGDGLSSKFGKFAKGLGLAGIGFAAVTEGFKLVDFAFKEFSGANKRAADALAGLETAANGALVSLSDLTPAGQRVAQESGKTALESFSGSFLSNLFTDAAGKNPEIQKQVGLLAAQGIEQTELKKIIENKALETAAQQQGYKSADEYTKAELEKAAGTEYAGTSLKDLVTIETLSKSLSDLFQSSKVLTSGRALSSVRSGFQSGKFGADTNFADVVGSNIEGIKNIDPTTLQSLIDAQKLLLTQKKAEQQVQNEINFGERLSLEIAKKRVDSVLEIAKLNIQATTEEEARIQLQEQTLDLSNRQKILNEARLKQLDLEKKKQTDILDSIGAAIDKAQQGGLSVSEGKLKDLQKFLEGIDLSEVGTKGFSIDPLAKQLKETYGIGVEQARNLINSVKEEQKAREGLNKTTSDLIDKEKNRKLQIDGINQALASQLSTIDRIASTAASIGNLNISGIDLGSAKTKAQITGLQAQLQDPNLTEGQKNAINTQINSLEKILNLNEKRKVSEDKIIKSAEIAKKIYEKQVELDNLNKAPQDEETIKKINVAKDALANLGREQQVVNNTYDAATLTLDANNASLDIQASQIGKVAGAYASLQKQLEAFRLGAGERVAGAQLGLLSATDPNALARSSITQQVELEAQSKGLNDQDYYKFVNQETVLREKQYELAVETSNVRKIELQRELDLMRQIAEISAATDEERLAKIKEIVRARQEETQGFGYGFNQGLASIQDNIDNFRSEIGQQIPTLFSQNLAQGLNDAISGAKSLKDALRDAATSFFQAITQKNIENIANLFTSGLGGAAKSTGFFASGGQVNGGSGVKDDVPAMLMGGEYVIKKSSVQKYGSKFLDSLNRGSIKGFASGGGVQSGSGGFYTPGEYGTGGIRGKRELLSFATQSFSSGQYDTMGGFGMSGASVSLEAESGRLSQFGRQNNPMFERVQESKQQAFDVYLQQLKQEEQYQEQLKEMEAREEERQKQLVTSIVSAVVSSVVSVAGARAKIGAENQSALNQLSGQPSGLLSSLKGAGKGLFTSFGNSLSGEALTLRAITNPALQNASIIGSGRGVSQAGSALLMSGSNTYSKGIIQTGGNSLIDLDSNVDLSKLNLQDYGSDGSYNPYNPLLPPPNGWRKRASGGLISGGSGMRDDVPAMLSGGEFVLNNRATRKLGVQNLNRLNAGETNTGEGDSSAVTESLISKLDELIQATRESAGDNVVVNVSSNEAQAKTENTNGNEKELQRKIKQAVLDVIAQEKRLGGSLTKGK